MRRLEGKVAIVTGASSGIGRATAVALAKEGVNLALVARREVELMQVAVAARESGVDALVCPTDITDSKLVKETVRQVVERWGRVDLVVNVAGITTPHRNLADMSVADWRRVLDTNATGAFLFIREALPYMRSQRKGLIINISSGAGLRPVARAGVAYCASKHAVHALTGSTNLEERRNGIRACVIAPGETDTPAMDQRPDAPSPERRALFLRPEDVADAVVYVATQPDSVAVELLVINPAVQGSVEADFDKFLALGHTATRSD